MVTLQPKIKELPKFIAKFRKPIPEFTIHTSSFTFGLRQHVARGIDLRLSHIYYLMYKDNEEADKLIEKYTRSINKEMYNFLFEQSDCSGEISINCVCKLLSHFKRYDPDTPLGKPVNNKVPTIKELIKVLEYCEKHKKPLIWY